MNGFIAGLKGFEHSGYYAGIEWIEQHGGKLVSVRRGLHGQDIETYCIRFDNADVLATWGYDTNTPKWRFVVDSAKKLNS